MLATALLAALLAASPRVARGGDWGLTDVYEARRRVSRPSRLSLARSPACFAFACCADARAASFAQDELLEYYSKFTGNLTGEPPADGEQPAFLPGAALFFEGAGLTDDTSWPNVLRGVTSAGADVPATEAVLSGVGFATSVPNSATSSAAPYPDALRACGPSDDASFERDAGCTPDLRDGDPYGSAGDPGFGPAQWAYGGSSMGPPAAPTGDDLGLCAYSLSVEVDEARRLECRKAPARGGVPWPQPYADALAVARFSAAGARLPAGAFADRLPPVFQAAYATVPLRWGFEEGTLAPYWSLLTEGLPTLAVTRRCLLEAHSGEFQLCSAYPWPRRNATHGLLHVRSVPFVLGAGDLTWQMNGGDATTPQLPRGTLDMAINGEGVLGVTLSRASDGYRVLGQPARAERFWALQRWPAATLAPHVGEKFVIDVFDYRCCSWGWLAVDSFVIPAAWVQITSLSPSGGAIGGGSELTIVGKNFGSLPEGLVVFIGELECGNLQMPSRGTLRCIAPVCDWCMNGSLPIPLSARSGLTVSVVVGDRTRALERGAMGGHQAGHCGSESTAFPFSRCAVLDPTLPEAFGTPASDPKLRGFTFRAAPEWAPSTLATAASVVLRTAVQDREFEFSPRATHPDLDESELFYSSGPLPGWLAFEPGAPALTGTPLVSDAVCPYGVECTQGVPYALTFTATDGVVRITLSITILVTGPQTEAAEGAAAEADLLPAADDGAYSWASEDEWNALRARARNSGYALRLASALLAQEQAAVSAAAAEQALADGTLTEDQALDAAVASGARGPVQKALATLMARAAQGDGAVDAALTMAMAARAGAGASAATGTAAARLRLALRKQQDELAAEALAALPLGAGVYSGTYSGAFSGAFNGTLRGHVSGSFSGVGTFGGIAGYVPPAANASSNVSGTFITYGAANGSYTGAFSGNLTGVFAGQLSGELSGDFNGSFAAAASGAYGGWFFSLSRALEAGGAPLGSALASAPPGAGAGPAVGAASWPAFGTAPASSQPFLAAAPIGEGDDFTRPAVVVPPGGELASVPVPVPCAEGDAQLPSCLAAGFPGTYTLWLALPPGGLSPTDAALEPADFPHADLLASGLASGDVAALAAALAARAAAYARRRQEVAALPARYAAAWAPASALLTLQLQTPLPQPAPPLVATLDLAHAYPAPPPGAPAAALWEGATTVRVLRLDGIAYHADEAAEAITADLALMSSTASLTERVAALEAAAGLAAGRCANDCSRRGTCDYGASAYPPRCLCAAGATGSDCSAATCPSGCSGRGACDSLRVCVRDAGQGTVSCTGGTGRCACFAPWTGSECSQRDCGSAYATLEGLNTTGLSADGVLAGFSSRGYAVDRAWVAGWDGLPRVRGAITGDEYSRAGPTTGVAVVRFTSAAEGARAREEQERIMPRVPARGVPALAPLFMTQYRAAVERERYLLRLFGLPTSDCSGRGTCNITTGACACDPASGAVGAACELRTCPAGCSGHGACDAGTGECACDTHYVPDALLGCALAPLGLASTVCEDAALDDRLLPPYGMRAAPLQLSCLLGVPLGAAAAADYCPEHPSSDAEFAASGGELFTRTCYTDVEAGSGPLCADCSGYAPLNVSQLHIFPEEGCAQRPPELQRAGSCVPGRRPSDVVAGLGAPPPTGVSFQLEALRTAGVRFSTFTARAGVVRRYASCGDCGTPGGYCGAAFTVLLDGAVAYDAVVATSAPVTLDVRGAKTLTLRTRTARGPHWRLGDAPYSGEGAPGLASQPTSAPWCDGAGWADAKLS
jgi:hypothetical protein